ncbi:hypothetical protein CPB84DRAFT_1852290 [Gymnopilus junonius]|uniref:Uncharacterized protein n=1 Tax=Gymnopilus junonius TaxID=109634 RepID=A0A9P5NEI5_GYMJU|nr:hypothetical protein CPB84DRAFT_1852290 [Gymnopilus junonius]
MPPSGLPRNLPQRTPLAAQAQAPYAPPEVVRLSDSAAEEGYDEEHEYGGSNNSPPKYQYEYTTHPSASSYALPYPYPSAIVGPKAQQSTPVKTPSNDDDDNNGAELYSSPFESDPLDVVPAAPRSTTSSSSTSKAAGNGAMTKSRWNLNLKLQLHSPASKSIPSLPAAVAAPRSDHAAAAADDPFPRPSNVPAKHLPVLDAPPVNVDTDVYNHAYNYPLAKQLSPIAELSPGPDSRSASLKFSRSGDGTMGKPSPRAESSAGSGFGSLSANWKEKEKEAMGDVVDRESLKTRTGSMGSVGTVNGNTRSRAGSVTMGAVPPGGPQNASPGGSLGSELTRPSPIYSSPFITRHLNRTVSQTSSKSDSQPQGQVPQPQAQAPSLSIAPGSRPNTGNSSAPASGREVPQTPILPGTATTTPTGTMYTPTSTLQTPVAQTPITPGTGGGGLVIQPLPVAVTTNSLPPQVGQSTLPKIPSLPVMSPIDLRFSSIGSVAPRSSREIHMSRHSKVASTSRQGLGKVERLPVIEGSVEGFFEEEVETEESDGEEYEEDEYEDEEYDLESLHAESFVTAGTNEDTSNDKQHAASEVLDPELGVELATLSKEGHSPARSVTSGLPSAPGSNSGSIRSLHNAVLGDRASPPTPGSATGESFIHRRWDRDAALSLGRISSSPATFRTKGRSSRWPFRLFSSSSLSAASASHLTPAFWAFWLGFVFPVLWLVGGWHFTNAGELPPKVTVWEWYFWNSHWSIEGFRLMMERLLLCCRMRKIRRANTHKEDTTVGADHAQRRKGKRRSNPHSNVRAGKIYPALPRWVAERQTTDDGRMRLNDPKRSLRGISFGYPFISRPPGSQDSFGIPTPSAIAAPSSPGLRRFLAILDKPNRLLDLMYGVKLTEVRGRPESGRRMFDPWIQRCRYAFCYGLALIVVGLCTASVYLIVVNTKKLQ